VENAVGTAADFALGVVWILCVGESGHDGDDGGGRELHDGGEMGDVDKCEWLVDWLEAC